MTFPSIYNITRPKANHVRCLQSTKALYDLGGAVLRTPGGNEVRVHCMERTLCDILRSHSRMMFRLLQTLSSVMRQGRDATIKELPVNEQTIREIFDEIYKTELNDDVKFSLRHIGEIQADDEYTGYRVALTASYPPMTVPLQLDIRLNYQRNIMTEFVEVAKT